jgi:hypothetical protein
MTWDLLPFPCLRQNLNCERLLPKSYAGQLHFSRDLAKISLETSARDLNVDWHVPFQAKLGPPRGGPYPGGPQLFL